MDLHGLHSSYDTSVLHDDITVVGFSQSKNREACAGLLTDLQESMDTVQHRHLFISKNVNRLGCGYFHKGLQKTFKVKAREVIFM